MGVSSTSFPQSCLEGPLATVNNGYTRCCSTCSVLSGSNFSIHNRVNCHRCHSCTFSIGSISFLAAFTSPTAAHAAMVPFRDLLSWFGMLISKLWPDMSLLVVSFQQLLQTADIANVYADGKTFVDKVRVFTVVVCSHSDK
jgi:hypothetical protein